MMRSSGTEDTSEGALQVGIDRVAVEEAIKQKTSSRNMPEEVIVLLSELIFPGMIAPGRI